MRTGLVEAVMGAVRIGQAERHGMDAALAREQPGGHFADALRPGIHQFAPVRLAVEIDRCGVVADRVVRRIDRHAAGDPKLGDAAADAELVDPRRDLKVAQKNLRLALAEIAAVVAMRGEIDHRRIAPDIGVVEIGETQPGETLDIAPRGADRHDAADLAA